MEFETSKILIEKKVFDKIVVNLQKIREKSTEDDIIYLATDILNSIREADENSLNEGFQGETLIERIKYKMRTTKDKDLNLKLYMLYRKLEEGKVPELEALKLYEMYLGTEYTDQFVL